MLAGALKVETNRVSYAYLMHFNEFSFYVTLGHLEAIHILQTYDLHNN